MAAEYYIREYVDDYIKYYPEKWEWTLKNTVEQNELYMRTRARRSPGKDLLPDFYSIEKDAAQFGKRELEWTDFFGLTWQGKQGLFRHVGAPNYKGSLYYAYKDDDLDDYEYIISAEYDAYDNQPPKEVYTRLEYCGVQRWIDTANVVEVKYKYLVTNHLFKDTRIELIYSNGEEIRAFGDYEGLISGLCLQGKEDLVKTIMDSMNEHFIKLRDSDKEEKRKFYPDMTAEEMFLASDNKKA